MIKLMEIYNRILLEGRIDILKQQFVDNGKIKESDFKKISEIDPTLNKSYLQWILTKVVKDEIAKNSSKMKVFLEDGYKLTEYLDIFNRLKHKFPKKDINQYSLDEFKKAATELKNTLNPVELAGGKERTSKYQEFYLGNARGFDIYEIPKGRRDLKGMSCDLGGGTEWCTATGKTDAHFNNYINQGPLFIIIKGNDKYQFHYETNSFMDKMDNSII